MDSYIHLSSPVIQRNFARKNSTGEINKLIKALKYWSPFDENNDSVIKLFESKEPEVVPLLIESLKCPEAGIRQNAALVLGHREEKEAVGPLINCLNDTDRYVRATAANSLKKLRDERAVPELIKCLNDIASEVRRSAAIALKSIDSKEAKEALKKLAINNYDLSLKDILRSLS